MNLDAAFLQGDYFGSLFTISVPSDRWIAASLRNVIPVSREWSGQ